MKSTPYNREYPFIFLRFNQKLLEYDETTLKPIILDNEILFYFVKHNNLTCNPFPLYFLYNFAVLAVSRRNSNAMMIFAFLYKFQEVLTDYFKELEEESIRYIIPPPFPCLFSLRDNFVIIYELLDEMMDNGYPQITEVD